MNSAIEKIHTMDMDQDYLTDQMDSELSYTLDFHNINLEHYRDLDQKVKMTSGYAMMQVEPFPRMKIMKIGLIMLDKLTLLPKDFIFRIYMGKESIQILIMEHWSVFFIKKVDLVDW